MFNNLKNQFIESLYCEDYSTKELKANIVEKSEEENAGATDVEKNEPVEPPKKKLKIGRPNPIALIFFAPAILILIVYVVVSNLLLPPELDHEAKIEKVLAEPSNELGSDEVVNEDQGDSGSQETQTSEVESESILPEAHNYYEFGVPFAVNIKDSGKVLTFEIAISTFQSLIPAKFFIEGFVAFVPAVRSQILYEMEGYSLKELEAADAQDKLVIELRRVINETLEGLGAKPEVHKVLFKRYIVT